MNVEHLKILQRYWMVFIFHIFKCKHCRMNVHNVRGMILHIGSAYTWLLWKIFVASSAYQMSANNALSSSWNVYAHWQRLKIAAEIYWLLFFLVFFWLLHASSDIAPSNAGNDKLSCFGNKLIEIWQNSDNNFFFWHLSDFCARNENWLRFYLASTFGHESAALKME